MKTKKLIMAIFAIAVVVTTFTLSAFALSPPAMNYNEYSEPYYGVGALTSADCDALYTIMDSMDKLGYFRFGKFLVVGRTGSTTRLYIGDGSAQLTIGDTDIVISGTDNTNHCFTYAIMESGWFNYAGVTGGSQTITIPKANCVLYSVAGMLYKNPDYTYGSGTSAEIISQAELWATFADKVLNYDTNLQNARDYGYEAGYEEGLEEGFNEGQQSGLTQGYQQGYTAGEQIGYGNGYNAGYQEGAELGYDLGYDEGYDDGVASVPPSQGGDVIISESLDIPSVITSIPSAIRTMIDNGLDIDIFGINIGALLVSLLVVAIVAVVIKFLLAGGKK